jgi:hypothetical protein
MASISLGLGTAQTIRSAMTSVMPECQRAFAHRDRILQFRIAILGAEGGLINSDQISSVRVPNTVVCPAPHVYLASPMKRRPSIG